MYYLLLEKFNNYFNRIIKWSQFTTVANYTNYQDENHNYYIYNSTKSTNFNKNDNITATHVFNDDISPDYLLWIDETTGAIVSRWFVLRYTHLSGKQFKAFLKRDLICDYINQILYSEAFIEKGYVENSDPAVYNKEDITVNQIKTSETILRDDSKTSWIVGFLAQDHPALTNKSFTFNPEVDVTISGDFSDWSKASWCDGTEKSSINTSAPNRYDFCIEDVYVLTKSYGNRFSYGLDFHEVYRYEPNSNDRWYCDRNNQATALAQINWYSSISVSDTIAKIELDNPSYCTTSDYQELLGLIGKKIQFDDGVYELSISYNTELQSRVYASTTSNLYSYLYNNVNNQLYTNFGSSIAGVVNYPVSYVIYLNKFRITATKLTDIKGTFKYNIPQSLRKLEDAPYKMFCIPYYKDIITTNPDYGFSLDGLTRTDCKADLMLAWAFSIAKEFGSSLYDLQILPYCPLSNWRGRTGTTNAAIWSVGKTEHVDYEYLIETIEGQDYSRGVISFCDVSTKEQILNYTIDISNYKIENQCDMYRLCSPNYASVFEFNAAKNLGVSGYNVKYTYKPFQPFILVAPIFKGLYGNDFKDNRGLICAGDFSLAIVNSDWINYQLQNKNYQLAFDRDIENLENQYSWQRKNAILNAATGTLKGGTTGAIAGGVAGGVPGAIAGGIIGTASSLAGGIMDLEMQKDLHNKSIDLMKDKFGYALQNIQALPNTLNKVSSIMAVSKMFPFVEFYTCTAKEKQAVRDKIKYDGNTIMRIGTIGDFLDRIYDGVQFIKCKLIRNETIACSSDELLEIYNELDKGVYL